MARQLADQFADHLPADAEPTLGWGHGEVQNVQLGLVQFIDHEADDFLVELRDHANAVALPQATKEVFFGPGMVEALLLRLQNLGHIAANHPPDMDANLVLQVSSCIHGSTPPLRRSRTLSGRVARSVPLPFRLRPTFGRKSRCHVVSSLQPGTSVSPSFETRRILTSAS